MCKIAEDAGADFVKTSTGFHPSGGASVRAVELMARTVGDRLGVKASGGIRTAQDAVAMLEAPAPSMIPRPLVERELAGLLLSPEQVNAAMGATGNDGHQYPDLDV